MRLPLDLQVNVGARQIVQAPLEIQIQKPLGPILRVDRYLGLLQIPPIVSEPFLCGSRGTERPILA